MTPFTRAVAASDGAGRGVLFPAALRRAIFTPLRLIPSGWAKSVSGLYSLITSFAALSRGRKAEFLLCSEEGIIKLNYIMIMMMIIKRACFRPGERAAAKVRRLGVSMLQLRPPDRVPKNKRNKNHPNLYVLGRHSILNLIIILYQYF